VVIGVTLFFTFPTSQKAVELAPAESTISTSTPTVSGRTIPPGEREFRSDAYKFSLLYPIWIIIKWFKYGRDPDFGPAVTAYFEGPKNASGRELTPAESGALIDEIVHVRDISATLVDLARRGYFKIEERDKNGSNNCAACRGGVFKVSASLKAMLTEKSPNFFSLGLWIG
jgi:hypothetical protein